MSILLSGIKMPRTCYYCRFQSLKSLSLGDNRLVYFHSCSLLCKNIDDYENNRREDCPLVEVSTPHGRLIDSNELKDLIVDEFDGICTYDVSPDEVVSDFQSIVDKCKTIIKMEE